MRTFSGLLPSERSAREPGRATAVAGVGEGGSGGGIARHPVHSSARKRRGAAEIQAAERGAVRRKAWNGAEDDLAQAVAAAADVAPDEIAVAPLELGRAHDVARKDPPAKARREPLDLRLDPLHLLIERRAPVDPGPRTVRIGPRGVLAGGRPRRIGE